MSNLKCLLSFFLFFFFFSFASSSYASYNHSTPKCSSQQSLALLMFKQSFSSINYSSSIYSFYCGDELVPVMKNWKRNSDCCKWNGVLCNHFTGDVISLDLSCGMLQGDIHPNTTLFHLPHLQRLNLAYNDLSGSKFLQEIGRFPSTLTHLNISHCLFEGEISSKISFFPKLVSLDLSWNGYLWIRMQPYLLNNLLQNSSHLRVLSIDYVNISGALPTCLNVSSPLKILILEETNLQGKLPNNIFNLPYLETLGLGFNFDLTGTLPEVSKSASNNSLTWLDFSDTNLSGEIPKSIGHLKSLAFLDLSGTYLSGEIPQSIGHLKSLTYLDLSGTYLSGEIPQSIGHLKSLTYLDLSDTYLSGEIPQSIRQLKSLIMLDLSRTNLSGEIPHSIRQLKSLIMLDLSRTNLSGEIPDPVGHLMSLNYLYISGCQLTGTLSKSLVNLRNLSTLYLSDNMLNGTLPSFLFTLPLLTTIYLDGNMFSGGLPLEFFSCQSLKKLSLSSNQFDGEIHLGSTPPSHIQLINLTFLDLSYNNFTGLWEFDTFLSMTPKLTELYLSYSGFSVVAKNATANINVDFRHLSLASCKLTSFPKSLQTMINLESLDLSNNNIHGQITNWAWEMGGNRLSYLDLSFNSITSLPQFQWNGLSFLDLQSNQIQGPFPQSICNMSNLRYFDMSDNNFNGVIPRCVENISTLIMIDLRNNHFHGTIPNVCDCGSLESLLLNGNQLEGEVPTCFSKCSSLRILDLGKNLLNGIFPHWLGDLLNLQVLDLKSNLFHGPLDTSSTTNKFPFPRLQVLDASNNGFVGRLPRKYFENFNAMRNLARKGSKPEYLEQAGKSTGFYYSIIVVVKGVELSFSKIAVDYTIVDLSNNKFEGEIPNVIGTLKSLIVLNLSHNNLNGHIPHALGNLCEIESLDLSWNQLTGKIPQSLVDLKFLSCLNLSENHLVGRIPQGKQFNTFSGNSYEGNLNLCGFPLSNDCERWSPPPLVEADGDEEENGFTWKVVMLGFGCGSLIGLVMGYLMLSTGRPKWFNAIAAAGEHMIHRRHNKRRYIYIGK